jgi:outer membrane protein insertion porin family
VNYTLENVRIRLTDNADQNNPSSNVPPDIMSEVGYHLLSSAGAMLAYDTRNSVNLPNKGQRTALTAQLTGGPLGGEESFYRLELQSARYFPGLFPRHVLEIGGRAGVVQAYGSSTEVPFFERYYLGGVNSLRGFEYRYVSPRQPGYNEPVGGDTYWFASVEYSLPLFEQERGVGLRLAFFYDIGSVGSDPYDFNVSEFSDNWGIGLRLNLPIGPLRLDYGIPIHHDEYNSGSGQFQFSVGWERPF